MIILSILKWIFIVLGCVVAGVIALVLVILSLVLFVPIRYHVYVTGDKDSAAIRYSCHISYLLHALSIKKKIDGDSMQIRIFGILKKDKNISKKSKKDKSDEPLLDDIKKDKGYDSISKMSDDDIENKVENKAENKGILSRIIGFFDKIRTAITGIKEKINAIKEKILFSFKRITDIMDFIKDKVTKSVIKKLLAELMALIRYIMPVRIRADVVFGLDDPSATGKILGGISMCPIAYKKGCHIRPDFSRSCFYGDVEAWGRIRIIYLLRLFLRLYFDKEMRTTWKRVRGFRNS